MEEKVNPQAKSQTPTNEGRKYVYDKLKEQGYNVGSYGEFDTAMSSDEDSRRWAYDELGKSGVDLGEYAEFEAGIGYTPAPKKPRQKHSIEEATTPKLGFPKLDSRMRMVDETKTPLLKTEQYLTQAGVQEDGTPIYDTKQRAELVPDFDPQNGGVTAPPAYLDVRTGKTIKAKDKSPEVQRAKEEAKRKPEQITDVERTTRDSLASLDSDIDSQMSQAMDRIAKENAEKAKDTKSLVGMGLAAAAGSMPGGAGMAVAANPFDPNKDAELNILKEAKRRLDGARNIIAEADHNAQSGTLGKWLESSFAGGAARGLGQKLFDARTWDMGLGDLAGNKLIKDTIDKVDAGKSLTKAEKMLLDALSVEMATNAYFGSYVGFGYTAGKMAAESTPFMLEMALNPLSATGSSMASKLARYAIKRYGLKVAKGLGQKALRVGARAVGDAVGSLGMTLTTGSVRTAGDIVDRTTGDVHFGLDDNNRIVYDGHEQGDDLGTAIYKAVASRTIENYSEMFGNYLGPLLGVAGRVLGKGAAKVPYLRRATELLSKVNGSQFGRMVDDLMTKTQWQGAPSEYVEEVAGNVMNALLVGDKDFSADKGKGVFNLDDNIDTFLGVSLMSGAISMAKTVGYRTPTMEARKAMERSGDKALRAFGDPVHWGSIRSAIDTGNETDLHNAVAGVLRDKTATEEQKKAVLDYAKRSQAYRGMEEAKRNRLTESGDDATAASMQASYENGYTLATPQQMSDAKNNLDYLAYKASSDLGISRDELSALSSEGGIDGAYVQGLRDRGYSDQQIGSVLDWFNAKATYDGMIQHAKDDIADQTQAIHDDIDANTAKDGTLRGATIDDGEGEKRVYIVDGNVSMLEDGSGVDKAKSDDNIIIRDPETGEVRFVHLSSIISADEVRDPEVEKARLSDEAKESIAGHFADQIEGKLPLAVGDVYSFATEAGESYQVSILQDNGDGTMQVEVNGEQIQMSGEELQAQADLTSQVRVRQYHEEEAQRQAELLDQERADAGKLPYQLNDQIVVRTPDGGETIGYIQAEEDEDGRIEVWTDSPINGRRVQLFSRDELDGMIVQHNPADSAIGDASDVDGQIVEEEASGDHVDMDTAPEEYNAPEEEGEYVPDVSDMEEVYPEIEEEGLESEVAPEQEDSTALGKIPLDENGEPSYESVPVSTSYDALMEQTEGDADMVDRVIDSVLSDKRAELKNVEASKVKHGSSVADKIRAEREREARLEKARGDVAYWEQMKGEREERRIKESQKIDESASVAVGEAPEYHMDNGADARERGYVNVSGYRIDRQEPLIGALVGKEHSIKFATDVAPTAKYAVIDVRELQASHNSGVQNARHFIPEAQPKDRSGSVSVLRAESMARNIKPEEITGGATAYTGSPVVNSRGEVIQGNGRSDALRIMWSHNPDVSEEYKQYLVDHADKFGLDADAVRSMRSPVLVHMVDVDDSEAIRLGQYKMSDIETGGEERIDPSVTAQKMGSDIGVYASLLFASNEEGKSLSDLVSRNGVDVLQWMNRKGYISDNQYSSALNKQGALTAEAREDLKAILYQILFDGGHMSIKKDFEDLPKSAQNALLQTVHRAIGLPDQSGIISFLQKSIGAYAGLLQYETFRDAKSPEEVSIAIDQWAGMQDLFSDRSNGEIFGNFALKLAEAMRVNTQRKLASLLNELYDVVQGSGEDTLFEAAEATPKSLEEAIIQVFGLKYGDNGSMALADNSERGESGGPRGSGEASSGEPTEGEEGTTERRGGTDEPSEEVAPETGATQASDTTGEGYRLSAIAAKRGGNFFENNEGSIDLVKISDNVFEAIGIKPLPLRMTEAMAQHIIKQHAKELGISTQEEAVAFVVDIMQHFDHVREGNKPNTYIFSIEKGRSRTGKRAVTLVLPSKSGEYLGVSTSGYEKVSRLKERALLWEEGANNETPTTETASANVTSPSATQVGMTGGSASNQSNALSQDKDSEKNTTEGEANGGNQDELSIDEKEALLSKAKQELEEKEAERTAVAEQAIALMKDYYDSGAIPGMDSGEFHGQATLILIGFKDRSNLELMKAPGLSELLPSLYKLADEARAKEMLVRNYEKELSQAKEVEGETLTQDKAIRDELVNTMRDAGIEVVTDEAEGQAVLEAVRAGEAQMQRAYHGTDADFEAFDHSHMGEGAGGQAYGWGSYFTEEEGVARSYAGGGFVYEVELPDDTGRNYLHFESKPSKKDIARVKRKLVEYILRNDEEGMYDYPQGKYDLTQEVDQTGEPTTWRDLYGTASSYLGSDKEASAFFHSIGYVGIRYNSSETDSGKKNLVIFDESDISIQSKVRLFKTTSGEVYGFVKDGKIYLDLKHATAETAIHEYTHLWASALRRVNPRAWKSIRKQLKSVELWADIASRYPELKNDEDALADEVLAQYSGKRGAQRIEEEMKKAESATDLVGRARILAAFNSLKEALKTFWTEVADFLGMDSYKSVEDTADKAMSDLLRGVNPNAVEAKKEATKKKPTKKSTAKNGTATSSVIAPDSERYNGYIVTLPRGGKSGAEVGDIEEFVGTDEVRPSLMVVYHAPEGFAVAVNGTMAIADKTKFDVDKKGKAYKLDGTATEVWKALKDMWQSFISTETRGENYDPFTESPVNITRLSKYLDRVEQDLYNRWKDAKREGLTKDSFKTYRSQALVSIPNGRGGYVVYPYTQMRSMVFAAKRLGVTSFFVEGDMHEESSVYPGVRLVGNGRLGSVMHAGFIFRPDDMYSPFKSELSYLYDESVGVKDIDEGVRMQKGDEDLYLQETSDAINARFNEELKKQIEGTLPKGHIYSLGMPSYALRSAGVPNLPIELTARRLAAKASQEYHSEHPFELSDIQDLPKAIAHPIAVFDSSTREDSTVVLTELQDSRGVNFVVVLRVVKSSASRSLEVDVNDIRSIYPKDRVTSILKWITSGKMLWVDKKKTLSWITTQLPNAGYDSNATESLQDSEGRLDKQRSNSAEVTEPKLQASDGETNKQRSNSAEVVSQPQEDGLPKTKIAQQRTNIADVDHLDLDSITKVVETFENPPLAHGDGGIVKDDQVLEANDEEAGVYLGEDLDELGESEEDSDIRYRYTEREDGTLLSENALEAEEAGKFPKAKFRKVYGVTPTDFEMMLAIGLIVNSEWHHTGKTFRETKYYSWADNVWLDNGHFGRQSILPDGGDVYYSMDGRATTEDPYGLSKEDAEALPLADSSLSEWYKAHKKEIKKLADEYKKRDWEWEKLENVPPVHFSTEEDRTSTLKAEHFYGYEREANTLEEAFARKLYWDMIYDEKGRTDGEISQETKDEIKQKSVEEGRLQAQALMEENRERFDQAMAESLREKEAAELRNAERMKHNLSEGSRAGILLQLAGMASLNREQTINKIEVFVERNSLDKSPNSSEHGYEYRSSSPNDVDNGEDSDLYDVASSLVRELGEKAYIVEDLGELEDIDGLPAKAMSSKGWYNTRTGEVVVVLPNHTDEEDVARTVLHEVVGHKGIRAVVGDRSFEGFLDKVYKGATPEVRKGIIEQSKRYGWNVRVSTEEYIAELAERGFADREDQGMWNKIKEAFGDLISRIKLSLGFDIGDRELRYMLWRSWQMQQKGGIIGEAENISKQMELGVGNFGSEDNSRYRRGTYVPPTQGDGSLKEEYDNLIASSRYQMAEAVQDSMKSVSDVYKMILEKEGNPVDIEEVDGYENAYLGENRLSSVNQAEMEYFSHQVLKPFLDEVGRIVKSGSSYEEVTDYMMSLHGLERNRSMAFDRAVKALAKDQGDATLEDRIHREYLEDGDRIANEESFEAKRISADAYHKEDDRIRKSYVGAPYDEYRQMDYAGLTGMDSVYEDVEDAEQGALDRIREFEKRHDVSLLWKTKRGVTDATRGKLYETGMISKETNAKLRDMYRYYIPLRGFADGTSEDHYGYLGEARGSFAPAMKRAKGRKSQADDPIAQMSKMFESAVVQGNRNKLVKQKMLNFVMNHPSELFSISDLWLHYNDVTEEWEPVYPEALPEGASHEEVEDHMREFEERMIAAKEAKPSEYKRGAEARSIPYRVLEGDLNEHQMIVKRGGRSIVVTINGNPRFAQAINGMSNPDSNMGGWVGAIFELGSKVNRVLSALYTTKNPDFLMSNIIRDMLYSNTMVWVKESPSYARRFHANIAKYNPVVLRRLLKKHKAGTLNLEDATERHFYQFMMNGGETGYTQQRDIEGHKNEIQRALVGRSGRLTAKKAFMLLGKLGEDLNRAVENVARFSAYVASRDEGRSIDRSIYDAKEISVNFNKKGAGSKFYNAYGQTFLGKSGALISGAGRSFYVFWNAAVQGLSNYGRAVGKHPYKGMIHAAGFFTLGVVIPLMAYMNGSGDGDDDYWDLPEYVRRSNICFNSGDGTWVTIPLPQEMRAVYGLGELAVSTISGKEHRDNMELAKAIVEQVTQVLPLDLMEGGGSLRALYPSFVKPLVEASDNVGWTGMPIYKDTPYNKSDPEWTKAYRSTNSGLVWLSKTLNELTGGDDYKSGMIDFNPAQVEYILKGYFGGAWSFANKLAKSGEMMVGDRSFEWNNIPLANRVIKTSDERTKFRNTNNEYYKYKKEAEEVKKLERKYEKSDNVLEYAKKIDELQRDIQYRRYLAFEDLNTEVELLQSALKVEDDPRKAEELTQALREAKKSLVDSIRNIK